MTRIINNSTVKEALKWVSEERQSGCAEPLVHLVQRAAQRFDLGPLDAEFLLRMARADDSGPKSGE
ncbi:hypothetical protein LJC24_05760 [Desulfococcaceae bacterium OttesenSCG-928-F15]|nr:hypothetical protein [Desulfococcaceae bacterium OttesenSCG-928-F15]